MNGVLRWTIALAIVLIGSIAICRAEENVRVVDGDTIVLGSTTHYRLWGIDAPESKQDCPDGFPAGRMATTLMRWLTAGKNVECMNMGTDQYHRIIATCTADGADLGKAMVRNGLAWAYIRYSSDYKIDEQYAKDLRLGVHAHDCELPWKWRHK